ncbi:FHA domain-containing protein [Nocardia sp. NPDC005366]|uniref:FHA domain-containing protein n=1 Tax=Nocardia sp. NPDC005366 TaxID=3156878 RepID=UPI0033B6EDE2
MRKSPSTVGIAPGDGLIARFGAVLVYLAGETASTDRILGAIEAVANTDHPGAAIAQRLAAVVFGSGSEPPPFGVVAPTSDGTVILLRGPVIAEIQGAEGVRRISGARAFTWVDEIVREPVRRITVCSDSGGLPSVHPRTDLRSGVVPGGGFELRVGLRRANKPVSARADTSEPDHRTGRPGQEIRTEEPAHTAPAGFDPHDEPDQRGDRRARACVERNETNHTSTSAERPGPGGNSTAEPVRPRRLSEVVGESTPVATAPPTPEHIGTQAMPGGWSHTLRSGATAPPVTGHDEVPPDDSRTRPARPGTTPTPVGALVFDDTAYPLDRPYVIGRSPMSDDSVRNAAASPLSVPRDRHVSRIHAYVTVERGKVFVRDAGTPAGTFIAAPGAESWTRIGTTTTELAPGWSIRIGEKILTYRADEPRVRLLK